MEQKHAPERSLVLEPSSRQHWTATITQVLLVPSLLSDLLLGGFFAPHLFSWTVFGTIRDVSVWGLAAFFGVLLCVVSNVAYAVARQEQWRGGRKLALWGWVGGILGVVLVLGVLVATMRIDASLAQPGHAVH